MIFNTKCLWTLTFAILHCILKDNLCHCKSAFDVLENKGDIYDELSDQSGLDTSRNEHADEAVKPDVEEKRGWNSNFAVWGKRLYGVNPVNNDGADLSIAQINPDKRKWSKFVTWGKRESQEPDSQDKREQEDFEEPLNIDDPVFETSNRLENELDKRKWQALTAWGKRRFDNYEGPYKGGWSGFTSWGKRAGDLNDLDKRKWQFTTWGKRNAEPYMGRMDKRKWSKFSSWGKRDDTDSLSDDLYKRGKWAKFVSWGKRSEIDNDLEAAKRKWSKFTSWGKRDYGMEGGDSGNIPEDESSSHQGTNSVVKRNWSKFSSWGKRLRNPQAWLALNTWGKRRWNGLTTWGKRSGTNYNIEAVTRKLLDFFDQNGDGALDFDELHNYIRILMSLPSKQETEAGLPEVSL